MDAEPNWSRGATPRNLLHKDKLQEFLRWAEKRGYVLHPRPLKAIYEVARLEEYTPSGNNPHIVIYKRLKGEYLTLDVDGRTLVSEWLRSKLHIVRRRA